MNVLVYDNEEQIGIAAGNYMCGQVLAKPNSVLGLATGSTPLKPYGHMIKLYEAGAVDFSKVTTFNLDEYCKLDVNDVNSYHRFMHDNLFDHINIPEENINFLNGNAENLEEECKAYEERIKKSGGIDVANSPLDRRTATGAFNNAQRRKNAKIIRGANVQRDCIRYIRAGLKTGEHSQLLINLVNAFINY